MSSEQPAIQQTVREALLTEIAGEIIAARQDLDKFREDIVLRAGISQDYLESADDTLKKYLAAANAHFTATKGELKDVARGELRETISKSLVDAHKHIALNRPKLGLSGILTIVLASALIGGSVGLMGGYLGSRLQLSGQDIVYMENGKALEAVWPSLKKATKDDLHTALGKK